MLLATSLSSRLDIGSRPLAVSCAYSGRVAVASADAPIQQRLEDVTSLKIKVAIYECESTGEGNVIHDFYFERCFEENDLVGLPNMTFKDRT